jgi:hypothetical protein
MSITPPASFIRDTPNYWVLEEAPSKSSPGKFHEVRMSKNDGKTYCTCLGWIFKARKGDGICKHIAAYMKKGYEVVVYKIEEFIAVHRAQPVLDEGAVKKKVNIHRRIL